MTIDDVVFVYQMKSDRELSWHGRHHCHGNGQYEFHYFLQGEGSFLNAGVSHALRNGMLFLSHPGGYHEIRAADIRRPISYYAVLFTLGDDDETSRLLSQDQMQVHGKVIGTTYRFFFEQLRERGTADSPALRRSAEYQLLSFIYSQAEGEQWADERNHHIEKALRIMQQSVFGKETLQSLSGRLSLSSAYLVRLFREKMRTTPMKYYSRLKVEAASSMLISTEMTVSEIADRLCFSSEFHFSRNFKQATGLAPTEYRRRYLQHLGLSHIDSHPMIE